MRAFRLGALRLALVVTADPVTFRDVRDQDVIKSPIRRKKTAWLRGFLVIAW
jgi:hypothetical protein